MKQEISKLDLQQMNEYMQSSRKSPPDLKKYQKYVYKEPQSSPDLPLKHVQRVLSRLKKDEKIPDAIEEVAYCVVKHKLDRAKHDQVQFFRPNTQGGRKIVMQKQIMSTKKVVRNKLEKYFHLYHYEKIKLFVAKRERI